ncbi:hypothetical protein [Actinomadura pelletieri]|nr:hypothetical protein [Actinomadura pelletieri]
MCHNTPATDSRGRVPNSLAWCFSRHGANNFSRGFGLVGMAQAGGGSNFTELVRKHVPDYNRRDDGLYKDPPAEG